MYRRGDDDAESQGDEAGEDGQSSVALLKDLAPERRQEEIDEGPEQQGEGGEAQGEKEDRGEETAEVEVHDDTSLRTGRRPPRLSFGSGTLYHSGESAHCPNSPGILFEPPERRPPRKLPNREGVRESLAYVIVQEGETLESALRRFKRKVQQEDIIKEIKRHSYYLKPGEKRRLKQALARKRSRKKRAKEME